ncbi:energy transducer TonB [Myroides ceti]|jgi:protein TonB|uniref:Energy transducer TonB n=1 Tax=Paenimyroides ceti TaxID=395087 RepID=A0ABT8CPA3_9FLAO|nr:energy transducer TonB [Paenimyroides ceti]MDN3706323.1 energy transducer TonB [Paenimyroides ceti]
MANINIFGKDWTNIVFEGRNKSYGAYKLRQDNGKNTFLALILGIAFIGIVFGASSLYGNYKDRKAKELNDEGEKITEIVLPPPIEEEPPIEEIKKEEPVPEPPKDASKSVQEEKELTEVKVKKDNEVKKEVKTAQEEFTDNTTSGRQDREADKSGDFKSDGKQTGGAEKGSQGTGTGNKFTDDDNKVHTFVQVKAAPVEGIKAFYTRYSGKFNAPDLGSGVNQIKVTLKFVVERDGSFTDIQVVNDQNGMGKEAIRVLKTMPKWKPAEQNGKTVRSSFTLPITIKVAN